jgi:hypothetical protein
MSNAPMPHARITRMSSPVSMVDTTVWNAIAPSFVDVSREVRRVSSEEVKRVELGNSLISNQKEGRLLPGFSCRRL